MKRGMCIVIDGLDGSGKATQAKLLADRLRREDIPFQTLEFPAYDTHFFGGLLAEALAGKHGDFVHLDPKIASILYSLDRFESKGDIEKWLAEGKVIIADRFSSSNQIHQGGKLADPAERREFLTWLDRMEHDVLGVPRPGAVVYLRVPVVLSLELLARERAQKNPALSGKHDAAEKDATYIENSYACVQELATRDTWHIVECAEGGKMRSPESIHEDIYQIVSGLLATQK